MKAWALKQTLPFVLFLGVCVLGAWPSHPLSSQQRDDRLTALESRIAELERLLGVDQQIIDIFEASRSGIVRVLAGLGHGTGFFVRADNGRRFIVTNDHVVAGGNRISVLLDSSTHVLAHFVASDPQADLALIEIHNSFCADCAILELASASEFQALRAGAKVVAVGFPLHQQQTLTTGIVSAQADGAVFTDVTLNPGNSGGPLMALSGHVVAVNTFIDQGDIGSGISGSVAVGRLRNLIGQSDYVMQATLSIERLPFVADTYPMELLRRIATDPRTDIDVYRDFSGIKANRFVIDIATPAMHVSLQIERDEHVTRQRRQREDRARLPESSRYANLDAYRDWTRFVGGLNRPVISISVTPILGENLVGRTRFRGDLEGISLSRNGLAMTPVQGGTHPIRERDDVAYRGLFVYGPEPFTPYVGGVAPEIKIALNDLKNPLDQVTVTLKPEIVARLWNDFVPYLQATRPNETFVTAHTTLPDDAWISRRYKIALDHATEIISRLIDDNDYNVVPGSKIYGNARIRWTVLAPGSMRRISIRAKQQSGGVTEVWVVVDDVDTTAQRLFEILSKGLGGL